MAVVKYAASAGERILEHLPELCHPVLGPESGEEEDTENGAALVSLGLQARRDVLFAADAPGN
jgi:hypothetical protein